MQSRRESLEVRAQESAALEIYRHGLTEAVKQEKELISADALSEVLRFKTSKELKFLKEFLEKANGSPAAVQIVAENVELLYELNTAHVTRTYGRP